MSSRSPLKSKPLRNPGQSLDEEINRVLDDQALPYFLFPAVFLALATIEWLAYLRDLPRQPVLYTAAAVLITVIGGFRLFQIRKKVQQLKLGRDGERAVGQFLERLRVAGARIFHDVPGEGFNLDHVVISAHGLFVVETKTWSRRSPNDRVDFDGESLLVGGRVPDRDPIVQARAASDWLRRTLEESTGKRLPVRGVVVFPGWFVEPMSAEAKKGTWVLEPKALPAFIEKEPQLLSDADVALAAFHLGRYVRTHNDKDG
jgi:hypothetical protein